MIISGPTKVMINDEAIQEKIKKMDIPAERTGKRFFLILKFEIIIKMTNCVIS